MTSRISPKTGRVRKRTAKPRQSLTDRLANLHLLLQSNSFQRWPLAVTFYAEDVYRVWQKWIGMHSEVLQPGTVVKMDRSNAEDCPPPGQDSTQLCGIKALDVSYLGLKSYLEKSQEICQNSMTRPCKICSENIGVSGAATLCCPNNNCSAVMHMECLSSTFLASETNADAIVPVQGPCPECGTHLQWVDLVKALSLRMRGEREMKVIFRAKRGKKAAATANMIDESDSLTEEDDALEAVLDQENAWKDLSDSSNDDDVGEDSAQVVRSAGGHGLRSEHVAASHSHEDPVIDDSDWENAEIVT